jgi:integral membrane sensor domain MASE1
LKPLAPSRDFAVGSERSGFEFRTSSLVIATGLIVAYFFCGKLGLHFATVNPSATAVWAPSGISLAACLLFGSWVWPAVLAGAFLVNVTTYGSIATSLAIAAGNTLEALTAAYLVRRFARGPDVFELTADTFRFVFFAAVLSTTVSATIGVTGLCVGGYASWSHYPWIWFTWWMGDAAGDLILTPLLILWARSPVQSYGEKTIEAVLLVATLLLTTAVVFGGILPFLGPQYRNAFLCIPVLLWTAFRFGPRETATVMFLLSIAAIVGTIRHHGPLSNGGMNEALLFVQAFVGVVGTSHLVVAIEVAERRRLEKTLWRLGALVESAGDAIIAITPEGRITDWNAGVERMYGFSVAEAIGKHITIIIPPDRMSESVEVLARINNGPRSRL